MTRQQILPTFFVLFFFSLVLLLAGKMGLTQPVLGFAEQVTMPLREGVYRLGQGINNGLITVKDLWGVNSLRAENEKLKKEILALQGDALRGYSLEEENKALRKQLEAPLPASLKFLPAKTLGLGRYLTIDKGEEEGVRLGMIVISENNLVGKIVSVSPKTSSVMLPQDPNSKIPGQTLPNGVRGLVVGEFGTKAFLDKVLQADKLESGDLVMTIGEGNYNRDLLIGKLGKVEKKEVDPFQKAQIEPLLDYGKLVNVFIITK